MRAIPFVALFWLVASPAAAQTSGDSSVAASDRYVIDAAKLVREGGARSFADLLISQVPGLLVVPGSGLNGGGSQIRFAGVRSLISDAPLILVDGIRVDAEEDASLLDLGGPGPFRLEDLSVEDITSIEVLRGPVSGAIYGPGAGNGVILIHTRAARSGPAQWETFAQGALESVPSRWPANYGGVDPYNANPAYQTGGCNLTEQALGHCVQDHVQSFNPLVERSPFANVVRRQAGFSGSGGPSWGAFRLSGTFDGDDGPYAIAGAARDFDRYSRWGLRGKGIVRPLPALEIGLSGGRMSSDVRLPTYLPIQAALYGTSDKTLFPAWDSLVGPPGTQAIDRTLGALDVRGTPIPGLTLRGSLGLDDVHQRDDALDPGVYRTEGRRRMRHNTAAVSASIHGPQGSALRWGVTVGLERLERRLEETARSGRDTTPFCGPGAVCGSASLWTRVRSLGTYITGDFVVHERLTVSGALRRDHYPEYRFADTRPSVGMSWVARSSATGVLNRLQIHGAYGSATTPLPDVLTFVVGPFPAGPSLRPDRTRSAEVGADAGLLGGRGTLALTFYDERSDVVALRPLPQPSGYTYGYVGGSKISNRGVAISLAGRVLDRPSLGWDIRLSMWGNRNRMKDVGGAEFVIGGQYFLAGYPTGSYLARRIRSYADANGDGVIVPSEIVMDSTPAWAGTPYPTQGAALTSGWRFGRWRASTTLEYRAGHSLFNLVEWLRCAASTCRGRNDRTASLAQQAAALGAAVDWTTDFYEDDDFLKVRELALTFDVPATAASALRVRAATVTLVGRNLLTWTGYSGPDPEAGSYPTSLFGGPPSIADVGTVPPLRSWTLRVQLAY